MKVKFKFIFTISLLLVFLLSACQPAAAPVVEESATEEVVEEEVVEEPVEEEVVVEEVATEEPAAEEVVEEEVVEEPAAEEAEVVTLEFYHWFGADIGDTLIKEINDQFEAEYPNIKIEFETADTDTYEQVITTRLSAKDAPDLFGVFPGTKFHPIAEAGLLMDLSEEAWVADLFEGAKFVSSYNGKVMTMPQDANVIGVIYNKGIFADLGLEIPTNWEEFLAVCDAIKASGVTPLAFGLQDAWVTQMVPFAMAPSAIYRDNIDFDALVYSGEATFVGSPWQQMMEDYVALKEAGYTNEDVMGAGYEFGNDMMANGEAAMLIQGNWAIASLREKNPDAEWGMFPLPYDAGGDVWVSSAVGITTAISANTEHPEEAKQYLAFWARPDIQELYLTNKGAFPVSKGVSPEIDPAAGEMIPYLEIGSYPFLDQNWPPGVQDAMFEGIQSVFTGEMTIEEMLAAMDTAWQEGMQ
jgi:raffinose/stachyose/melibiose transport system substrate-binding protein